MLCSCVISLISKTESLRVNVQIGLDLVQSVAVSVFVYVLDYLFFFVFRFCIAGQALQIKPNV